MEVEAVMFILSLTRLLKQGQEERRDTRRCMSVQIKVGPLSERSLWSFTALLN